MAYSERIIIDYDNTLDNEDEDKASRLGGRCNGLMIIDRMTSEVKDVEYPSVFHLSIICTTNIVFLINILLIIYRDKYDKSYN